MLDTPIGPLFVEGDPSAVTAVRFGPGEEHRAGDLDAAVEELTAYFAGQLTDFDLPLRADGTPFQQRVWAELRRIPFGETWSYGALAAAVGNPKAARAVGMANNRNPVSIVVPCHRVIGAGGSLTGYGGGLDRKAWLLDHERRVRAAAQGC